MYTVLAHPLTADGIESEGDDYATEYEALAEMVNWLIAERWTAEPDPAGGGLIAVEDGVSVYRLTIEPR
ncbi:hypothetical protein CH254_02295 [Rhodococcus sp. 06-412-2C]|uniref:hypothetical protein n=1 Tax=unclassified Rhodococcus (in: high G+C Gram-positive bacteria) TaxID=192944 RepID=UPI000B9A1C85|nr:MULTISPECIES: hypothetical protein [unclassified Rhodococcus (in: high G+C Gram-positive bacteria)]OZC93478.1 hypothetical protein CH254_02295 [Rhodococcus sp. 06-412-2C]OZC95270.1 hypothetical protein CH279_18685 [Rhodococcus sp. 06-412-2B]